MVLHQDPARSDAVSIHRCIALSLDQRSSPGGITRHVIAERPGPRSLGGRTRGSQPWLAPVDSRSLAGCSILLLRCLTVATTGMEDVMPSRTSKVLTALAAALLTVPAPSASADVARPIPLTPTVKRSTAWGGVKASASIRGLRYSTRTSTGPSRNHQNRATFWLSQSGRKSAVRGTYGRLIAQTYGLRHLPLPGGIRPSSGCNFRGRPPERHANSSQQPS